MTTTLSRHWDPTDIIEIAPGLHAMKIHVCDLSIFRKSDIIILTYRYEMVLGYIYNITEDGQLHIVPLNEMPTTNISRDNMIGPVDCTLAKAGIDYPQLDQLLAAIAERDRDSAPDSPPTASAERDELSPKGVSPKLPHRAVKNVALGKHRVARVQPKVISHTTHQPRVAGSPARKRDFELATPDSPPTASAERDELSPKGVSPKLPHRAVKNVALGKHRVARAQPKVSSHTTHQAARSRPTHPPRSP